MNSCYSQLLSEVLKKGQSSHLGSLTQTEIRTMYRTRRLQNITYMSITWKGMRPQNMLRNDTQREISSAECIKYGMGRNKMVVINCSSHNAHFPQVWYCIFFSLWQVLNEYETRGFEFLLQAFNTPDYLEDITGLTELQRETENAEVRYITFHSVFFFTSLLMLVH